MKLIKEAVGLGACLWLLGAGEAWSQEALKVPGLVLGLRHSINQKPCELGWNYPKTFGGDLGADSGQGYRWMMIPDEASTDPMTVKLPPGVVVGLKHSVNQKADKITAFGRDPVSGPAVFPGFAKQFGGDLGAPSHQGYYWYESTGEGFTDADWASIERLPKGTVVGLKHTENQRKKTFTWQGKVYDPADANIAPPPGFKRMFGGDIGAPAHKGYFWYQKVSCPCSKAEGEGLLPACND